MCLACVYAVHIPETCVSCLCLDSVRTRDSCVLPVSTECIYKRLMCLACVYTVYVQETRVSCLCLVCPWTLYKFHTWVLAWRFILGHQTSSCLNVFYLSSETNQSVSVTTSTYTAYQKITGLGKFLHSFNTLAVTYEIARTPSVLFSCNSYITSLWTMVAQRPHKL